MAEILDKCKILDTPKLGNSAGNGIGLNLTKSLVELLGGQTSINSELEKSAEFLVVIPSLPSDHSLVVTDEKDSLQKEKNGRDYLSPRKDTIIPIVEDEKNIRGLLKDVLFDYVTHEVRDGMETLKEIEHNYPDIIISDIIMSNMDGLSLISRLKSDLRTSYIPIIGISAKASVEDQINAFNHGVDAYIIKPFHPGQVIPTIENLLPRQMLLKGYFNSSMSFVKVKDGIVLHSEDEELIQNVTDFIKSNIDDELLSPSSIAKFAGVSKVTLYRKFEEIIDKTLSEFVRGIRLEYAAKLLRTTKLVVSEIMFKCGFSNESYLYREFLKQHGVSPKDYRNQQIKDNWITLV